MLIRNAIRSLRAVNDWRLWALGLAAAIGWAWVEAGEAWSPPGGHYRAVVKLSIYWGLWLCLPLALGLGLRVFGALRRGRPVRALLSLLLLGLVGCIGWARFVEPNQLRVIETRVGSGACGVRVALVSDLHVGLYVREGQLETLVRQLNALDVDAVLVAGDWTYEPTRELRRDFAPIGLLRHPVYAVLGNHEEQLPGADLKSPLVQALEGLKVRFIEGRRVPLGRCELAGLGDLDAGNTERDLAVLAKSRWSKPPAQRVLLTHEPDSVFLLERGSAGVLLAGHTHGGQVNLPVLTEALLRRLYRGDWQRGLYADPRMPVFVTSGIGMAKLPLRFRMAPAIDVLTL